MKSSACGKFILGGEHSVVHKGCGLAFPLVDRRVLIEECSNLEGLWVNGQKHDESEWSKVQELRKILGAKSDILGMKIESSLPVGGGLGSSAAFCAALARLYNQVPKEELAKIALSGEKFFHGKPSGIDPFVVSVEKPIVYWSKDQKFLELNSAAFVEEGLCFVLVDSGLRHSTLKVIDAVMKLKEELPLLWEDLISTLADNAQQMWKSFESAPKRLGALMNDTHFRLLQLGVSCDPLDNLVTSLKEKGALGAKLTGAGKGGFVLGLFQKSQAEELKLPIVFG